MTPQGIEEADINIDEVQIINKFSAAEMEELRNDPDMEEEKVSDNNDSLSNDYSDFDNHDSTCFSSPLLPPYTILDPRPEEPSRSQEDEEENEVDSTEQVRLK
ncbi:hypothetical protein Moror_2041 [Moniliophthora roreri MCA 2997]|uniref:Uncharacterized protein n=2 Tax=Moniliophthora roreri TaxID=221103 RepID=V2X122_MONRO|nr:hypothetical protein Moror_2041 [Moniliophthora roreri MCA 2997]